MFSGDFSHKHGCMVGSTVMMAEIAYRMDAAWIECSKAMVKGGHQLKFVKYNPDQSVVGFLGGYGSHEKALAAHALQAEHKVKYLKETSTSSHANQGHDQQTVREVENNVVESLYDQRKTNKLQTDKTHIAQYNLGLTAIRIVNAYKSVTWIVSYWLVNINP